MIERIIVGEGIAIRGEEGDRTGEANRDPYEAIHGGLRLSWVEPAMLGGPNDRRGASGVYRAA